MSDYTCRPIIDCLLYTMLDIQIFYCVIRITKFSGNCNACANSVPQALWPVSRLVDAVILVKIEYHPIVLLTNL